MKNIENVKNLDDYMNLFKGPEKELKENLLKCLIILTILLIILIIKVLIFG